MSMNFILFQLHLKFFLNKINEDFCIFFFLY